MVKSILYKLSLLLWLLLYSGCAGSSDSDKNSGSEVESYYTQLGISFHDEFFGVLQHILVNKYQYDIARTEESPREIYFETAWKDRPVFADEVGMLITAARTRIIVKAKPRGNVGQYKLHFYAETKVRYKIPLSWEPGPLSKMLKKKLDLIAGDLRYEFKQLY